MELQHDSSVMPQKPFGDETEKCVEQITVKWKRHRRHAPSGTFLG